MAARRVLGEHSGWKVNVLASDLNPRFLQKAKQGIYGPWSFRTLPGELRERFFHQHGEDRWQIDDSIKRDVTFTGLNFLDDSFPSVANGTEALDVIFCRNVLMYFSRETAVKVIAKLRKCLVEDGWLFTSATDAPRELFSGFTSHGAEGTVIYRRGEEAVPALKPVVPAARPVLLEPAACVQPPAANKSTQPAPPALVPRGLPVARTSTTACDLRQHARSLADASRFDEALAAIDQAIAADKLDASAHYLRGVILHEKHEDGEAAASLNRALYLDHGFVLAHVTLGNLHRRAGREQAARRCFGNARDILMREDRDTVLPESGGMTAGRLLHMISAPLEAAA
jgi:chemotaxis protein methyltransferase CheR